MKNDSPMTLNQKILLSIILVIAALSRFMFLDLQSFWYDELFTQWACSINDFSQFVGQAVIPEVHPPLYNISMYFWAKAFGVSEIALRLPSAIAGVLLVWWMFKLGSLFRGKPTGLLAAGFTVVFWYPLYMSQEARSYVFVLLFACIFMFYQIKVYYTARTDQPIPWKDRILFVVSGIATMYIHYYTGMFVVLSMLFLLAIPRRNFLKIFFMYAIVGICYLPWLPTMYQQFSSHDSFWTGHFSPMALFGALDFITINYRLFSAFPLIIIAYYLIKKLLLEYRKQNGAKDDFFRSDTYLVLIITVPFVLIYVLSFVHTPLFTGRYYSFAYPAFVLLLSSAIIKLTTKKALQAVIILAIFICSIYSIVCKENYYQTFKVDYRSAYKYMEGIESTNRYPVLVQGFLFIKFPANLYAYYNIPSSKDRSYISFEGVKDRISSIKEELQGMRSDSVWYLSDGLFKLYEVDSAVCANFTVLSINHFQLLDLYLLKSKESSQTKQGLPARTNCD